VDGVDGVDRGVPRAVAAPHPAIPAQAGMAGRESFPLDCVRAYRPPIAAWTWSMYWRY